MSEQDHVAGACAVSEVGLVRKLGAEAFGTAFLLATVIGSGIMGERLAGGNEALALLGNTFPTGAMLVVLIAMAVTPAHFTEFWASAVSVVVALLAFVVFRRGRAWAPTTARPRGVEDAR